MKKIRSMLLVELTSGNNMVVLQRLAKIGIQLEQVIYLDEIIVHFQVTPGDYRKIKNNLKSGETVRSLQRVGCTWHIKQIKKHPLIVGAIILMLFGTMWLPRRILFVQVEGNTALPHKLILEKAENCGIGFWANRSVIRSEKVKNALLSQLPELKWAAVTTKGCTATIHLEEESQQKSQVKALPMNLVSVTDGIVQEMTVSRGTPLCKVGEAVTSGQVLISGYTDCGLTIQVTGAEGEVYGLTQRQLQAVAMRPIVDRGETAKSKTAYSIQIGKKLIKLYKDSGISDSSCVKIKLDKNMRLPGGKMLPVILVKEVWYSGAFGTGSGVPHDFLNQTAREYVFDHMQAGEILNQNITLEKQRDIVRLSGSYSCREMIGQITSEEYTAGYGESD